MAQNDIEYRKWMQRKAKERRERGFVSRTRPGDYYDETAEAGSRMGSGAAREQAGRDRFSRGHGGGGMLSGAIAEGMKKRRQRGY